MSEKYEFSFSDYHLTKIIFNINNNFVNGGNSQEVIEVNPKFEINYDKNETRIIVNLTIEFSNLNIPFTFDIGIVGFFDFNFDTKDENMESVVNINCASLLYPFLRETIADITRRAGFPSLILPPVNFVQLYKNKVQVENDI